MNYEIVIEVNKIPDKSIVRKLTGTFEYTLCHGFPCTVYDSSGDLVNVLSNDESFSKIYFLVKNSNTLPSSCTMISATDKLIWIVSAQDLLNLLNQDESD